MKTPITVLMSVFNGEQFLKSSISSVLNQSFTEFEFIIINDGSTDNSESIIRQFSKNDKRIKILNKKNTGLTNSLNQGIKIAKGEWIARIDSDDICEKNRLETQYNFARSSKLFVLIGSNFHIIDKKETKLKVYKYPSDHKNLKKFIIDKKFSFPHSSFFIKAKSLKILNGYNERMKRSQDYDLCLRLSEIGKISCINRPLVSIRKHENQVSHEDSGMRQLVDSRVALISFFLRQKGFEDPLSDKSSDELYNEFYNFVKTDSILNKFFMFRIFVYKFKINFTNFKFIKIIKDVFTYLHIIIFYFLLFKFTKNIEIKMMNKWIKKKT